MRKKSKYKRWHDAIISRAKKRELIIEGEKHHVVPRCLKGTNKKSNIVKLTYREHFLVHWLLTKFTKGIKKRKMCWALVQMTLKYNTRKKIISSWQFEVARKANKKAGEGKIISEATLAKRSTSLKAAWSKYTPEERKKRIAKTNAMTDKRLAHILALVKRNVNNPKWHESISNARKKQAKDPKWLNANREGVRRRSKNKHWIAANKKAAKRRANDPAWISAVTIANRRNAKRRRLARETMELSQC